MAEQWPIGRVASGRKYRDPLYPGPVNAFSRIARLGMQRAALNCGTLFVIAISGRYYYKRRVISIARAKRVEAHGAGEL